MLVLAVDGLVESGILGASYCSLAQFFTVSYDQVGRVHFEGPRSQMVSQVRPCYLASIFSQRASSPNGPFLGAGSSSEARHCDV